ncbi:hypothetical protein [Sphingosinithalassobacter sp. CS137]|jgi:hypothetical protein|uniref:hypothetical protein n=1 Tax=Sphingosinithalassobacter sp. CS137 TaxID=2762748 RepID=UPI00165E37C4|nr:hypothetical protein [Sphingosinithalassobacter sp. CS137]
MVSVKTLPVDENLQVQVPTETKQALERRAVDDRVPMRVVVLRALSTYGIAVPQEAIRDRRKTSA